MESRGQKRPEMVDELPADKRACSSLDFRPSSSNSSVQTHMNSTHSTLEAHDHDMDTSSSASASSRSEGEHEKDSAYGSCDSDEMDQHHSSLRDYQRRRMSSDHGKFKSIISSLSGQTEPSGQLAVLTELCEVLSFCTEGSLSSMTSDLLSPLLVKLAKHESNPDIMLFAIRAITYICDLYPRSAAFLVRHDAVPALCQRLLAIEYQDVAEQCLQALEKISREQPLACLQAGAIMAVLNYIDFFSTSIQRVALCTVVNICKKLPSESPSPFMEAVPILCNLLQYEDRQLVENVATCLIKIVERVAQSPEMLDELCQHGLIQQVTHLLSINGRTTLSKLIYNGLIGMLVKLASGSVLAFRTSYELNISSILRDILATSDLSHGLPTSHVIVGHCNQVYEVLKLLNELLPGITKDENDQQVQDKESFLANNPDLLQKLGTDVIPMLIQVFNSGASLYVCHGCLSVMYKIITLSKSDMLVELLKKSSISSFLAGVFTRKDHHMLMLALQISETILQNFSDIFLKLFIKEGVFFAIDALLTPERSTQLMYPVYSGIQLSVDSSQKFTSREALRCLCYAFSTSQSPTPSEGGHCKLDKDSVHNLAQNIKTKYLAPELYDSEKGLTDILQQLRAYSNDLLSMSADNSVCAQNEEKVNSILLSQIMDKLTGKEQVSTFEFIESGVVRSLVNYLSQGHYVSENDGKGIVGGNYAAIEKRFEALARVCLQGSQPFSSDTALPILIRNLQNALTSLEAFPIVLSNGPKLRHSYAAVPSGCSIPYPSLKVRFVRAEGETWLNDCTEDFLTVDPFSSLHSIEGYLWPKVSKKSRKQEKSVSSHVVLQPESPPLQSTSNASSCPAEIPVILGPGDMSTDLPETQGEPKLSHPDETAKVNAGESSSSGTQGSVEKELQSNAEPDSKLARQHLASCSNEAAQKLNFYLDEQYLDHQLTLYQAILHQIVKQNDCSSGSKLWSQVHIIAYRKAVESKDILPTECLPSPQDLSHDEVLAYYQQTPFFSDIFSCELVSDLHRPSPTYDVLFLLKCLESMNRFMFHLMSRERICAFAEGKVDNLDSLNISVPSVPQNDFVSSKLTEKLETQMRDSLAICPGSMPSWCNQLITSCPFLFSFEARCKYFKMKAFGQPQIQPHMSYNSSGAESDRRPSLGGLPRKKILVYRNRILESAAQMMDQHARNKVVLEVEYDEEVGTGLGPTLEFYTLVCRELQKSGLGMWRDDPCSFALKSNLQVEEMGINSLYGLFPRPWSSTLDTSNGIQFSEVTKKFFLLGQVIAKALQDGRVLDLHFSKAFYKLILGKELSLYDIQSLDPGLGRVLQEFQALINRKKFLEYFNGGNELEYGLSFRETRIEDLCLDFSLPGYPDIVLASGHDHTMVNLTNLENYVSLVVDATVRSGISRQVEAFKSGFNQVFSVEHLKIFNEQELERILCGEHDCWAQINELADHIKFDHGYTASSPPIVNLLEIIQEFDHEQRRSFLQFVTGAPRLPPGGLASLNPKLTIVRKHCSNRADSDLPSVMTCANYLKLPPYSSKERMKEKLLYAITEGQGSFHLS
ncbi:E3 ubiquitin-protein ligase UPL4 isoform X1 [Arachis duranensis]|uniref:HECT-type E3 ubiquitin transferase n=1 Tax=Arachis duranensis TaxID=130453 RepID=A0A6P4BRZ2_ARADU|nr:E3 ubiquitin-protein ligase UPL4 isoform X1 [Arachis duranensis]XP_052112790.1 E3 ubiquitin-protein ligase UPL4 isoform X1 [Arachis duranensis]XP_052112791.1 E3 ubiquitin-protein ligase UPL4 isoform X1 [Arachis duranensis]